MALIPETTVWWRRFLPFVAGFLAISLLILALATKPTTSPPVVAGQRGPAQTKIEPKKRVKTLTPEELKKLSPVERFVNSESLNVGRPDTNPKRSFERLKAVAKSLRSKDIDTLKHTALNNELDNDRRFLSVYILALAETAAVAPALMSIALDPLTIQDMSSQRYAEELMIRTQALEGLANYQPASGHGPLQKYLEKQDNAFLADQARRLVRERNKAQR